MKMELSADERKFINLARTAEQTDFPLYVAIEALLSRPMYSYSQEELEQGIKKLQSLQVFHPQYSDECEDAIRSIKCELNRRREVAKERGITV